MRGPAVHRDGRRHQVACHRKLSRSADLRARRLVLHNTRTPMGFGAGLGVTSTPISYKLAFGTYEDAQRMVGVASEPRIAGTVVSAARIQMFAATVQDSNPSYWDADFAAQSWGGLVAPPALLMGWLVPLPW